MSRLKNEALKNELKNNSANIQGPYASSFTALPTNSYKSSGEAVAAVSGDATVIEISESESETHAAQSDVEWEDGYEDVRVKTIDGNSSDSGAESMVWDVPLDSDEIDLTVLASLPAHMRKDLIEETRKRERLRQRSDYIPVASDPHLYSQTQISNFLRTRWAIFTIYFMQSNMFNRKIIQLNL